MESVVLTIKKTEEIKPIVKKYGFETCIKMRRKTLVSDLFQNETLQTIYVNKEHRPHDKVT